VERELEKSISTPNLKEQSKEQEKEERELSEEPEELRKSEEQKEELLSKDGESRELTTHKHGGAIDSRSIDGDSVEECREPKATGTLEDTQILERSSVLETGELLKNTGDNTVSKKEETSLLTET